MTILDTKALEAAREAVIHDPEVNISLVGVQTIVEVYLSATPSRLSILEEAAVAADRGKKQSGVDDWAKGCRCAAADIAADIRVLAGSLHTKEAGDGVNERPASPYKPVGPEDHKGA